MNNYRIDFAHNTIIMDYKFAKAAQVVNSSEYKTLKQITNDFPNMTTRVASHREQKTPHHNYRLTYNNMAKYMMTFDNSEELLAEFAMVQAKSIVAPQPYKVVRDWFVKNFPEYTKPIAVVIPKASFKSIEEELTQKYSPLA